jgi:hypothetical protein
VGWGLEITSRELGSSWDRSEISPGVRRGLATGGARRAASLGCPDEREETGAGAGPAARGGGRMRPARLGDFGRMDWDLGEGTGSARAGQGWVGWMGSGRIAYATVRVLQCLVYPYMVPNAFVVCLKFRKLLRLCCKSELIASS